jgi:hypothetical protein
MNDRGNGPQSGNVRRIVRKKNIDECGHLNTAIESQDTHFRGILKLK